VQCNLCWQFLFSKAKSDENVNRGVSPHSHPSHTVLMRPGNFPFRNFEVCVRVDLNALHMGGLTPKKAVPHVPAELDCAVQLMLVVSLPWPPRCNF
jgi:hypothetical protein